MKKLFFLMCVTMFGACNNEEEVQISKVEQPSSIKAVLIPVQQTGNLVTRGVGDGEYALSFDSEGRFQEFKEKLSSISDNEKLELVNQFGVRNLHNLAAEADDELESIGTKANSEGEFRQSYEEYKKKYEGILIPNNIDANDLSLYVPDEDNVETFIGNQNGMYVIDGEIKRINIRKDLAESVAKATQSLLSDRANAKSIDVNTSTYRPMKNKEIYFNAYMRGGRLWVKMSAKKKMWYGWKNDPHRSYYFDSFLSPNFSYLAQGQYGQEVIAPRLPRYIFNNNVKNGFNIILGKITGGNALTGKFHTWTDLTSEHDANGKDQTEVINGHVVPKCLIGKAHIININLK